MKGKERWELPAKASSRAPVLTADVLGLPPLHPGAGTFKPTRFPVVPGGARRTTRSNSLQSTFAGRSMGAGAIPPGAALP